MDFCELTYRMNSKASSGCFAPAGMTNASVSTMVTSFRRSPSALGKAAMPHSKSGGA